MKTGESNMLADKFHSWKPALFGFITLSVESLTEINIAVQILVGLATFTYIIIRAYYLVKNKGKEKK